MNDSHDSPEERGKELGIIKLPRGDTPAGEREIEPFEGQVDEPPPPQSEDDYGSVGPIGEAEPLPKLIPLQFIEGEELPPRGWRVHGGWIPDRTST
jgi:hypothetical protein